jgi:hypothetical protein
MRARAYVLGVSLGLAIAAALAGPAWAASNVLTWQDNSTNEANFHIERKIIPTPAPPAAISCGVTPATDYAQIATTGVNVTTFSDSAVVEGTTYCYRVKASNPAGSSNFSNEAGRTVPFTVPVAPSALGVTGGP